MAWLGRETAEEQQRAEAWRDWFVRQHPLALPALLLSTCSLTHGGGLLLDELAGIALGVVALSQIRRTGPGGLRRAGFLEGRRAERTARG